ncbi:MAG: type II and III secretion system protein family protein [Hyphomicrobiales bacterium]|nr:type II and III secretion system protein family protein [Hyphomicrobiales bacterium]
MTLRFVRPFSTAVIGSTDIADVLPMTETTLYIQGKKVGATNVSVFDPQKHLVSVVDLEVTPDVASLHRSIAASTSGAGINVSSVDGQVVLSGEAGDAVTAARAVEVAKGLSQSAPVINAMKVAPSQQVMLKVRFLEVDRNAGRDLGINWFGANKYGAGVSGLGTLSNVTGAPTTSCSSTSSSCAASVATNQLATGAGAGGQILPGISNSIFGGTFTGAAAGSTPFGALLAQVINNNGLRIDSLITALEDKGLVKTLAEPNLVSQSGQPASFFAGGQIPVPTVQPGNVGTTPTVSVQYYNCGVTLNFVPTVLNSGVININLAPQVCQPSTSSVVVNGTVIPQLNTRSANTTVDLRNGQSFAIAGLLEAEDSNEIAQLPWLGNLPVLGALFRSTNYQKQETALVVIVTVHLVRPVPPGKRLATPFDTSLDANDADLFLMGDTERKKKYTEFVTGGGGLAGPYGHILDAR